MTRARTSLIVALLAAVAIAAVAASAALSAGSSEGTVAITLPKDARAFGPGPGQSVAQANCTICHAADYVYTQPPLTADQWRAEVLKMQKAYGAPIDPSAVDTLVAYLVGQNGKQ